MYLLNFERYEDRTLNAALRIQAAKNGDETFVRFGESGSSFAEVDDRVRRLAHGFLGLGVTADEPVAVLARSSIEMITSCLAVNRLGGCWTPINVEFTGEWLANALADTGARYLVIDTEHLAKIRSLGGALPPSIERIVVLDGDPNPGLMGAVPLVPLGELVSDNTDDPDPGVLPSAPASVMWTSGTTGRPKGVVQSHHVWCMREVRNLQLRTVQEGDVFYCCLPMHNSGGWIQGVNCGLVAGLPVAIDTRFTVSGFWERLKYYDATQFLLVGAMSMFLWQAPPSAADQDHRVRSASCIPLPLELVEPFKERFGIERMWTGWGNSEIMFAAAAVLDGSLKPGSAGYVLPEMGLRILDDEDREVACGEVGEICIRPTHPYLTFTEYHRRPEATAAAFRNLWLHSGDLGRVDADGELFFVDRKADYLRYKGRNVSSLEVEGLIARLPEVVSVAVYGVASAQLESEHEIKACVLRAEGSNLDADQIARFVNDNAPHWYVPRYIEFVDEMPMTPTGRIQKNQLRDRDVIGPVWDRDAAGFEVVR